MVIATEDAVKSPHLSTRSRVNIRFFAPRTADNIPHMNKPKHSAAEVLARIDKRQAYLKSMKLPHSDRWISIKATGSPDTIRSIRRGVAEGTQTGISTETLRKLSWPLATTVDWLLTGNGVEDVDEIPHDDPHIESGNVLPEAPPPRRGVRLVGYVGAGSAAHYYALADEDYEEVEPPEDASPQTVAVEIRGKSFGPLMDGWLVFYEDVRSPVTEDLIGEICVIGLSDDRILLKQIRRERDGSWTLVSNSTEEPIKNAAIEWAARVTDMKRRRR